MFGGREGGGGGEGVLVGSLLGFRGDGQIMGTDDVKWIGSGRVGS